MTPAPMISVVVPVYNEEAALEDDLRVILATMEAYGQPFEVIVVDDGSTDGSAAVAGRFPRITLLRHPYNRGTGAALMTGISAAKGEVVVMTDADGTYPNQEMPRLLNSIGEYDMIVGARTSEQGTLKALRVPAKLLIRWLASYLTNTRIPDLNSGLRAFKREIVRQFYPILPFGHSWVSTITLAFLSGGYTVKYVPIEYYPRKGRSSFRPVADTYSYLTLVVRATMYFNPLKVFFPAAFILLFVGSIKFVRDIFFYGDVFYVPGSTIVILLMGVQIAAIGLLADLIVRRGLPLGRRESDQPAARGERGRDKQT